MVTNSYLWGLDFFYVLGLQILTFGDYNFLRLRVRFFTFEGFQILTFGGWISYVWGFQILTFWG